MGCFPWQCFTSAETGCSGRIICWDPFLKSFSLYSMFLQNKLIFNITCHDLPRGGFYEFLHIFYWKRKLIWTHNTHYAQCFCAQICQDFLKYSRTWALTLLGQPHKMVKQIVWVCLTILWGWFLKDLCPFTWWAYFTRLAHFLPVVSFCTPWNLENLAWNKLRAF